ncbi:MAG TPA: hypothetical protein VFW60_10045 [Rhodanobacteraceae bacterium]|nr:hypothetical protein [Rhodanobacteraceae bacterium]
MLKELIKHFIGTGAQPQCREANDQPLTAGVAREDSWSGSDKPGQKSFGGRENGPGRDWRPRLYW